MLTIVSCTFICLVLAVLYAQRGEEFPQKLIMSAMFGAVSGFFIAAMLRQYLPTTYQVTESFVIATVADETGAEKVLFESNLSQSNWYNFFIEVNGELVSESVWAYDKDISVVIENNNPRIEVSQLVYGAEWYGWFALPLSRFNRAIKIYVPEKALALSH